MAVLQDIRVLHCRGQAKDSETDGNMAESRRRFLKQSVATVAAASVAACAPDDGRNPPPPGTDSPPAGPADTPPPPLPATTLRAVAQAVLPAELGDDGQERAVAAFERWSDGLEPVAELGHPYLVPETRYSGPDPRPGWVAQLQGLEKESRSRFSKDLPDLDVPTRRTLLTRAVEQTGPGLGSPANANHVAVALMAHFFASPLATDLCYRRTIAKQQCRGLDGAIAEPAAIGDAP